MMKRICGKTLISLVLLVCFTFATAMPCFAVDISPCEIYPYVYNTGPLPYTIATGKKKWDGKKEGQYWYIAKDASGDCNYNLSILSAEITTVKATLYLQNPWYEPDKICDAITLYGCNGDWAKVPIPCIDGGETYYSVVECNSGIGCYGKTSLTRKPN